MTLATAVPHIFDRALVRARRERAAAGFGAHDFLAAEMAARLSDRLSDMVRTFPHALLLGCHRGVAALALRGQSGIEWLAQADPAHGMLQGTCGLGAVADEERLPFAEESFDLVLACGMLHWVNDLPGALVQIRRTLKPDGLFLAVFPGGETLHELRDAWLVASMAEEGGAAPRVSPFVDVRDAGALLQRAGFALPVADTDRITVRYADVFALMRDLRGMGEANALAARPRRFTRAATLEAMAQAYHAHLGEDGRIPATFELITLTAWKPHSSQQQPARRGSGKVSLAEVFNTG